MDNDSPIQPQTRTMLCLNCNSRIVVNPRQPRIRCPHCYAISYPDRSGRNLVTTAWECLTCGTINDGTTNFCLECSTGLTSRCLRCEGPVYTSVCLQCGSHQDALVRVKMVAEERQSWVDFQRAIIDEERAAEGYYEIPANERRSFKTSPPTAEQAATQEVDPAQAQQWQSMQPPVSRNLPQQASRQSRKAQTQQQPAQRNWSGILTSLAIILGGFLFLGWQLRDPLGQINLDPILQNESVQQVIQPITQWWGIVTAILSGARGFDTSSPDYAVFFAVTVFIAAAAPVILYLLVRLMRRMFP